MYGSPYIREIKRSLMQMASHVVRNYMEIRSMVAALIQEKVRTDSQANRRMDMTNVIGSFRDYENAPKNAEHYVCLKS